MFELAATAALGWVMVIWSQDGLANQTIKWSFLGLALWGAVETAHALNFFAQ